MRKKFRAAWILASRHCIEWSWLPKCGLQDTCASVVRRQVQWYAYMMTAGCDQHQAVLTHPRSHSLILPVVCCGLSLTVLSFWLPEAVSFPFHSSSSCPNPGLMYDFSNPVIQLASKLPLLILKIKFPFHDENCYLATVSITGTVPSLSLLYAAGVNTALKTVQALSHKH